jgi:uncharacterized protein (TIGR00255 family)
MLKSMTGFGRGEGQTSLGTVFVESRSVNHRYCDINIKLPKRLSLFENRMKEMIRSQVSRGRIDVSLRLDNFGEEKVQLSVDFELAEQFGWELPDVVLYPTGGGTGLIGMWKAFREMEALGWISSARPRMVFSSVV